MTPTTHAWNCSLGDSGIGTGPLMFERPPRAAAAWRSPTRGRRPPSRSHRAGERGLACASVPGLRTFLGPSTRASRTARSRYAVPPHWLARGRTVLRHRPDHALSAAGPGCPRVAVGLAHRAQPRLPRLAWLRWWRVALV